MKERPILFSSPMVQALLTGRKTQTRRIVNPQPTIGYSGAPRWGTYEGRRLPNVPKRAVGGTEVSMHDLISEYCPYGLAGDRLWVREAFLLDPSCDAEEWDTATIGYHSWADLRTPALMPEALRTQENVIYAASWTGSGLRWQPSIHMPRWASRLTLEITAVRLERLHDISEADAQAEGARRAWERQYGHTHYDDQHTHPGFTYRNGFHGLWCDINGEPSWDLNPWVWVVTFKVVRA